MGVTRTNGSSNYKLQVLSEAPAPLECLLCLCLTLARNPSPVFAFDTFCEVSNKTELWGSNLQRDPLSFPPLTAPVFNCTSGASRASFAPQNEIERNMDKPASTPSPSVVTPTEIPSPETVSSSGTDAENQSKLKYATRDWGKCFGN